MKRLLMQDFGAEELRESDPLEPPDQEDDILQRDIIGTVAARLMERFKIGKQKEMTVALAVSNYLIQTGIAGKFRAVCCKGTPSLRADIYAQIAELTNGARLDLIFCELGFGGLDDFFEQNLEGLKQMLLELGIDTDVRGATDEMLH